MTQWVPTRKSFLTWVAGRVLRAEKQMSEGRRRWTGLGQAKPSCGGGDWMCTGRNTDGSWRWKGRWEEGLPRPLCGPEAEVPTQRKRPWMWRDYRNLKGMLGLAGPELRHLFWGASRATPSSGL